jgi:hypothetical protein
MAPQAVDRTGREEGLRYRGSLKNQIQAYFIGACANLKRLARVSGSRFAFRFLFVPSPFQLLIPA